MSAPPTPSRAPAADDPALFVRGLHKRYGSTVAVAGLDLEVRRGECFGLLGPNGAGKTTTIEICEGLNTADAGDVIVLGRRWSDDAGALRERLGIQLQETQLSDKLTVEETVMLFRSFYARGRTVDECIDLVQLGEKRGAQVRQLSGGQKQRLALACAVVGDPELLFLDEPTTGLDPQARRQLWELIEQFKALGRTIVLTTHYMDEAERLADRVAIVDHGRVIALGTPRQLIAQRGADHVVEFRVGDGRGAGADAGDGMGGGADAGALDEATLCGLVGVRGVRRVADRWALDVSALHEAVPALLAELARRGLPLEELSTHSATLEDVFVTLTGRQLRDA